MISKFFINRPVFASVISIVILLAGGISIFALPIAQYPDIVPPQIVVSTNYPGATAEVIANTVAAPLEQEINGVEHMIYMNSSSSSSGTLSINVNFEVGTDPDQASIQVNNRVKAAEARLPEEVRRQGVTVDKRSTDILLLVSMMSDSEQYDSVYISNYALLNVIDDLKRVPGVGSARLFGSTEYSMRIWINPEKLAQYGLTPTDIASAISEQNAQFAAGKFGQEPINEELAFTYTVTTKGRLTTPEEFGNIIVRSSKNGASLRLKELARIELGAQDYSFSGAYNGKSAVPIGIFLQPGANALQTAVNVQKKMDELSARFPQGIKYVIPFDTTQFVKISIEEVIHTFAEAVILVILIVYLFLQNARATIIPILAVPVSIIGTFAGMLAMGFSINMLTLFGMILAIGIVVDDAIIVIENVERIMKEERLPPKEACIKAMNEVTGPLIAIVLVLVSVFVPVSFMTGLSGEMYRQFAVTIAVSVCISGLVALTLTPALCAIFLKPTHKEPPLFFRWFNSFFESITNKYVSTVNFFIRNVILSVIIFAMIGSAIFFMFRHIPGGLVPDEDRGYVVVSYQLMPATSLQRTKKLTGEMTQRILKNPGTAGLVTMSGFDILTSTNKTNTGASFVNLDNWNERKTPELDARNIVGQIMGMGAGLNNGITIAFNPPAISGISMTGGFEVYLQSRTSSDYYELAKAADKLVAAANQRPELTQVRSNLSVNTPQYYIELDRDKARSLDIPINTVFSTMQSTFGSYYVNDFTLYGRNYRVNIQSEGEFRRSPEDLKRVFVKSNSGELVPLASLITVKRITGPDVVERFNVFPAAKLLGQPATGYSSGQSIKAMEDLTKEVLGDEYSLGWVGTAYQEKSSSGSGSTAFIFGLIMVFLILAAQYERWALPISVIISIPFAIFGALCAIYFRGLNNDLYFQIGLVTLIGLSAKNAILIVEFAMAEHEKGKDIIKAALDAAKLRFRPIIMTSLAFTLGCLPLATSSGAGSASRHAIGTGVIGGMLAATFIATLFIPLFYCIVTWLTEKNKQQ